MIRALLRGQHLPRPLLLPIVFALGARLENLTLRVFLTNPTKIANSQRQILNVLRLDGVTCYFDPYLEAEALGCEVRWNADKSSCSLGPVTPDAEELRKHLSSPEGISARGRIPVACDVLRRLKMMLPGEPALMAVVTGPSLLASLMTRSQEGAPVAQGELCELPAEVSAAVSTAFLEAGANVLFIREQTCIEDVDRWVQGLAPIVNVIRFYEALPVLLFDSEVPESAVAALNAGCEGALWASEVGFGWPSEVPLQVVGSQKVPHIITCRGDVPAATDVKTLGNVFGRVRAISGLVA